MVDIRVPTLGESVTEATVGKWFKQAGDSVAVDEPLVELETDKVTLEVPAPAAGVLSDIAVKDGATVAVGVDVAVAVAVGVDVAVAVAVGVGVGEEPAHTVSNLTSSIRKLLAPSTL